MKHPRSEENKSHRAARSSEDDPIVAAAVHGALRDRTLIHRIETGDECFATVAAVSKAPSGQQQTEPDSSDSAALRGIYYAAHISSRIDALALKPPGEAP